MNPLFSFFAKSNFENLSPEEFDKMLAEEKNAFLLDVRTKEEYKAYHIPGAKLIDISSIHFKDEIGKLDKNKNLLVYCASGARSRSACNILKQAGFEKVYNLSGGICGWKGAIER